MVFLFVFGKFALTRRKVGAFLQFGLAFGSWSRYNGCKYHYNEKRKHGAKREEFDLFGVYKLNDRYSNGIILNSYTLPLLHASTDHPIFLSPNIRPNTGAVWMLAIEAEQSANSEHIRKGIQYLVASAHQTNLGC